MSQPVLVVDIDDTLNRLRDSVYDCFRARGVMIPPVSHWRTYNFERLTGVSENECLEILIKDRVLERCEPDAYAVELLRAAKAQGWKTQAWTARSWHPNGLAITEEWFDSIKAPIDEIRLFGLSESKADAISGGAVAPAIFIEDNPRHLAAVLERSPATKGFLLDRPWNRGVNLPRCYSLRECAAALRPALRPVERLSEDLEFGGV